MRCDKVGPFGSRWYKGRGEWVPYKLCIDCRTRQSNRYHNTEYGTKVKEKQKQPLERKKQRDQSAASIRKQRKNAAYALWKATEDGARARKEAGLRRRERIRNDVGLRLQESLNQSIKARLKGFRHNGRAVRIFEYSEFTSSSDLVEHFEKEFKPGMTLENYGSFWSVAHKIPRFHYDFSDEEEVRRCNSRANLGCDYEVKDNELGEKTNRQKKTTIPSDEVLDAIGSEHWPKAFGLKLSPLKRIELESVGQFLG